MLFHEEVLLIQATARSAPEREKEISTLVRKAEFNADPFAHEFGIAISSTMTEVRFNLLWIFRQMLVFGINSPNICYLLS